MDQTIGVSASGYSLAGVTAMNKGKPLANANPQEVLERLREAGSPRKLAEILGITHQSLYEWLVRHCPEDWQAISSARSLVRIETAADNLDTAQDILTVAKARESAKLAQWDLERMNRRMYGDNKADASGLTVQVIVNRGELDITDASQQSVRVSASPSASHTRIIPIDCESDPGTPDLLTQVKTSP